VQQKPRQAMSSGHRQDKDKLAGRAGAAGQGKHQLCSKEFSALTLVCRAQAPSAGAKRRATNAFALDARNGHRRSGRSGFGLNTFSAQHGSLPSAIRLRAVLLEFGFGVGYSSGATGAGKVHLSILPRDSKVAALWILRCATREALEAVAQPIAGDPLECRTMPSSVCRNSLLADGHTRRV